MGIVHMYQFMKEVNEVNINVIKVHSSGTAAVYHIRPDFISCTTNSQMIYRLSQSRSPANTSGVFLTPCLVLVQEVPLVLFHDPSHVYHAYYQCHSQTITDGGRYIKKNHYHSQAAIKGNSSVQDIETII